ncbi:Polyadenylate tail-binding protein [Intoshia linei]|uniref:Polyadenylate tail-binding protein n=1 Tax=Intoshia linei TaxID=1819745 RepID=A0A177AZ16_9BILA|nr:Polyadenylate tail-binding protein [Intoshia linei]
MSNQSAFTEQKTFNLEGCNTLYVGDLSLDVTESDLEELFKPFGDLSSVRLVSHADGTRSGNYAYINFMDKNCALQAMRNLNYNTLNEKSMRIMWSFRDPSIRKNGVGNIFIKNLDKIVDQKTLFQTFSHFGPIMSCKVVCDEHGVSKGYAFVHFSNLDHAKTAMSRLNGTRLTKDAKPVEVMEFIPKSKRNTRGFNNLYVKNFPVSWEQEDLSKAFSAYGEIFSCKICISNSMDSKKFGFVCYKDPTHAQKAMKEMHDKDIKSSDNEAFKLYVVAALKKSERARQLADQKAVKLSNIRNNTRDVNLYIKYLDDKVDDVELKQQFSVFGEITSAKVMRHENGTSKGFGFVCFAEESAATSALTEMKGKEFFGKPLYVSLAQKKDERKTELSLRSRQFSRHMMAMHNNYFTGAIPMNQYGMFQQLRMHADMQFQMPNKMNYPKPAEMQNYNGQWTNMHRNVITNNLLPNQNNKKVRMFQNYSQYPNQNGLHDMNIYFQKNSEKMHNDYLHSIPQKKNSILYTFISEFVKTYYNYQENEVISALVTSILRDSTNVDKENFFNLSNLTLKNMIDSHINSNHM